jgi:3-oxoacyl-(acyl-carrier-protein) synthase
VSQRIFIISLGCISAIGRNVPSMIASLNSGTSGLKISSLFKIQNEYCITGEANISEEETELFYQKYHTRSRNIILAHCAISEVLAPFEDLNYINKNKIGLISSNTTGGIDLSEKYWAKKTSDNSVLYQHDCGASTLFLSKNFPIFSYKTTINTACSSSANAILQGANMIKAGHLDAAIAGGVDTLTNFTIQGFQSLGIYDKEFCRPFDASRNGLNLGEGAGYIMMVNEAIAAQYSDMIIGEFVSGSNANDAYHQTASSPDAIGNTMAMNDAISKGNILPNDIDYINAHGTATPNNDASESKAILNVFTDKMPIVQSTKTYTGHTLAACGGIEAIISLESMRLKTIFQSHHFTTPIEETNIIPNVNKKDNVEIKYFMSNSFGFGGNCSSLIFKNKA